MTTSLTTAHKRSVLYSSFLRFFAVYFFIVVFPFPLGYLPLRIASKWYYSIFNTMVSWTGHHVFHIPFPLVSTTNGSGDTTFNYVQLFVMIVLTIIISIVWRVIYPKWKQDDRILNWIMTYVRFYFALIMIKYGLEKIIKAQFPFPFNSLNETYGESSPMRLMWSFMGYSSAYNIATGSIEILAGLLVFFRKSATSGALLSMAVLGNIVIMNICFDVPVKLFALNILGMAIFIVVPERKRLTDFFFRNKATYPVIIHERFADEKRNRLWAIFKFTLAACVLYSMIIMIQTQYFFYGDGAFAKTPLFGIYQVQAFVRNKDTLAPLLTDTTQWKAVTIVYKKVATIKLMNDSTKLCHFVTDTLHKKIEVSSIEDSTYVAAFSYAMPDSLHLLLTGKLKEDSVSILMQKQDLNQYRLINRGFHWINESPYNR